MVELGVADGYILHVELSVCEPGFATFWLEHRKLQSNSIYMTRRDSKLASDISGQTWISRHCFYPETINYKLTTLLTVEACGNNREAGSIFSQSEVKSL